MPIYLKYGDIKGDVTDSAHAGYIELTSGQWGVGRGVKTPTSGSADREGAAPSVSEITVTKTSDSTSSRLFTESVRGQPKVDAVVDFVRNDPDDQSVYLRLEMSETMISSWTISGSGGPDTATEALALNFKKIEFKKTPGTPPP